MEIIKAGPRPNETDGARVLREQLAAAVPVASESTELAGKCVVALATDPKLMKKTGRILTSRGLAKEYGLRDVDGGEFSKILPQ